jgi:hypothetical protein
MKVFRPGAAETTIVKEELNDVPVTRPRAPGDSPEITLRQRPKPAPLSAKRPAGARGDLGGRGFTGQKRPGENAQQRWVSHDKTTAKCSNESHPA